MTTPNRATLDASIQSREQLIYLLTEAAEVEHQLLLIYLFAAFSLKSDFSEGGVTAEQLPAILRWKRTITGVAIEEMLHLAMVNNLLTAVGGAPHFRRPNLPQANARYYPKGFRMDLAAFSLDTIDRFVAYENPKNEALRQQAFTRHMDQVAVPFNQGDEDQLVPHKMYYDTIHDLYSAIQAGFRNLSNAASLDQPLFLVPASDQLYNKPTLRLFGELKPIVDLASADEAIQLILVQGEGHEDGDPGDSHFLRFITIRQEYEALMSQFPDSFSPVRPVLANPFIDLPDQVAQRSSIHQLEDPYTSRVSALFNGLYEITLQLLVRAFAHTDETDEELAQLTDIAIELMHSTLTPVGELLTRLPAGSAYPGKTAGPSFQSYKSLHLLPHKRAAWFVFQERLRQLAQVAQKLSLMAQATPPAVQILGALSVQLNAMAGGLSRYLDTMKQ